MNLNEQLRQAYEAGRRQGLNEQFGGQPAAVPSIHPSPDGVMIPIDQFDSAPDGFGGPHGPMPDRDPLGRPGKNVMYPVSLEDGTIVYPDGTIIYPDGTVVYTDNKGRQRYISPKPPRNWEDDEDGPGPPP